MTAVMLLLACIYAMDLWSALLHVPWIWIFLISVTCFAVFALYFEYCSSEFCDLGVCFWDRIILLLLYAELGIKNVLMRASLYMPIAAVMLCFVYYGNRAFITNIFTLSSGGYLAVCGSLHKQACAVSILSALWDNYLNFAATMISGKDVAVRIVFATSLIGLAVAVIRSIMRFTVTTAFRFSIIFLIICIRDADLRKIIGANMAKQGVWGESMFFGVNNLARRGNCIGVAAVHKQR